MADSSEQDKGIIQTTKDLVMNNLPMVLIIVFIIFIYFRDSIMRALPFKFGGDNYHISNAFGITE